MARNGKWDLFFCASSPVKRRGPFWWRKNGQLKELILILVSVVFLLCDWFTERRDDFVALWVSPDPPMAKQQMAMQTVYQDGEMATAASGGQRGNMV